MESDARALFTAALTKLPPLDLIWPDLVREAWWRCFDALRALGEAASPSPSSPRPE